MKIKIKQKESNIDWDKPQLLISSFGSLVMSTGKHVDKDFTGVCIHVGERFQSENFESARLGEYCDLYTKSLFTPFKGKIQVS
jgi:hypothetical protein